jgi:cysteine desulfurase
MKKVYLDYAATTPVRPEVIKVMQPYWTHSFGNPSSIHSWGREAREAIEEARAKVASIITAKPSEIIFTSSITTSDNLAILGVINALPERQGHLITSQVEHHAVLDIFKKLEKQGFEVTYLPVDKNGIIEVEALRKALRRDTVLVSIMYANNEVGTVQPIAEIGEVIASVGEELDRKIIFHTDAATVAEYLPLEVKKLKVDLLSLGAHKFGGPKGVGILYVKEGTKIAPITFGGHHESGLWPGTEPTALIVGAAKALELAIGEQETVNRRVTKLRDRLVKGVLEKIPDVFLTGDPKQRLPDIASFVFKGVEGEAILLRLDTEGIAASSGSACTSGELSPSHVLLAMGIKPEEAHGSIRFSLGRETTEEELDYVLEKLPQIVKDLRAITPKACLTEE